MTAAFPPIFFSSVGTTAHVFDAHKTMSSPRNGDFSGRCGQNVLPLFESARSWLFLVLSVVYGVDTM